MKKIISDAIKPGDQFIVVGAVTGKTYQHTVQALTLTDHHDNGTKVVATNVVATNNEHGGKAVWALAELVKRNAEVVVING